MWMRRICPHARIFSVELFFLHAVEITIPTCCYAGDCHMASSFFFNYFSNNYLILFFFFIWLQKFIISCMNKMEQLFQEQRRNLLLSIVYAKQGLPPNINKESMKQPLKEQNITVYKQPKRNQDTSKKRSVDKKKQKSSHDVQDVSF